MRSKMQFFYSSSLHILSSSTPWNLFNFIHIKKKTSNFLLINSQPFACVQFLLFLLITLLEKYAAITVFNLHISILFVCFTVNTQDYDDHSESDMGDRESLYYDTISVASDATNRKSLSQSRLTIYHSAVDLAAGDTPTQQSLNSYRNNGNVYNQLSYTVGSGGTLPNRKSSLKPSCLQYHQQLQQSHPLMDFTTIENGGHALKDKVSLFICLN